jgi:hypothetical protein
MALAAASGASALGCLGLFNFRGFSFELPPLKLRFRFVLLAPFPQVANAANAELRKLGSSDRDDVTPTEVRWTVRDKEGEGEDSFGLREDANLLVAEFTVHPAPKQDLGGGAPQTQTAAEEAQQSGARKRSAKILKTIGTLPGVGPLVDRDGVQKDRQFRSDEAGVTETAIVDIDAATPSADGGALSTPEAGAAKKNPPTKRR